MTFSRIKRRKSMRKALLAIAAFLVLTGGILLAQLWA